MKMDIKKMCSELGLTYEITEGVEYGFVGDVYILEANEKRVYYFSTVIINRFWNEKLIEFQDLCSNDNKKCNYIRIKKILSKIIVKYKKLQIELRKENMKEDFV